jgi:hypothetical protein
VTQKQSRKVRLLGDPHHYPVAAHPEDLWGIPYVINKLRIAKEYVRCLQIKKNLFAQIKIKECTFCFGRSKLLSVPFCKSRTCFVYQAYSGKKGVAPVFVLQVTFVALIYQGVCSFLEALVNLL